MELQTRVLTSTAQFPHCKHAKAKGSRQDIDGETNQKNQYARLPEFEGGRRSEITMEPSVPRRPPQPPSPPQNHHDSKTPATATTPPPTAPKHGGISHNKTKSAGQNLAGFRKSKSTNTSRAWNPVDDKEKQQQHSNKHTTTNMHGSETKSQR